MSYDELVKRLRNEADCPDNYPEDSNLMREAADAIEEPQQQVVEYQLALDGANNKIAYAIGKDYGYDLEYGRQRWCDTVNDLKAAVPKWISVEERLPEDCQDVLVALRRGEIAVDYYQPNRWGYRDVTHWMPLPEPPKEEIE